MKARLPKELRLFDIYAIATGSTLSSGFFLLPAIAAAMVGHGAPVAYLFAALPLIPGIFAMMELATAMPRSGGVYYFIDRSLGPLAGTIGGIGVWLVVILKTVFAMIGIGVYSSVYLPDVPAFPIMLGVALFFGSINLFGARKTGIFQSALVVGLLGLLVWFSVRGLVHVQFSNFARPFRSGLAPMARTAAMLCVSYVGLTKVASVAEEVRNPERNLPLGVFLALGTALLIYAVGAAIVADLLPADQQANNYRAIADVAQVLAGPPGAILVTVAAVLAFSSVANAGILSASRYPLAMSRDRIFPGWFAKVSPGGVPRRAVFLTVIVIVLCITLLDPTRVAKLASAFQLLMFAITSLVVIVMRESGIDSYDPGYKMPFYPWLPLAGIVLPFWFIYEIGPLPLLFTLGLVLAGALWYRYYSAGRTQRGGAIYHIFARLGERKYEGLDHELRQILREKGLRSEDPFDRVVMRAAVIDLNQETSFEECVELAARSFSDVVGLSKRELTERFLESARAGSAPLANGVALPHVRLPGLVEPHMLLVRSRGGIAMDILREFWGAAYAPERARGLVFLTGPDGNARLHLRMLAELAEMVEREDFIEEWIGAQTEQDLKESLLRQERFLALLLEGTNPSGDLIGKKIREVRWEEGTIVAMIHRRGRLIIPQGDTILKEGDRITVLGQARPIARIRRRYEAEDSDD
ncbi:MAG: amino acid permease [Spirochaetales bacterium]|nr:amino acid permease [Leptospiraceae bacterium]MCP5483291.1 amino acid permease [Spirochaetales bacterium]